MLVRVVVGVVLCAACHVSCRGALSCMVCSSICVCGTSASCLPLGVVLVCFVVHVFPMPPQTVIFLCLLPSPRNAASRRHSSVLKRYEFVNPLVAMNDPLNIGKNNFFTPQAILFRRNPTDERSDQGEQFSSTAVQPVLLSWVAVAQLAIERLLQRSDFSRRLLAELTVTSHHSDFCLPSSSDWNRTVDTHEGVVNSDPYLHDGD